LACCPGVACCICNRADLTIDANGVTPIPAPTCPASQAKRFSP
jgi:hypothetical protein